MIFVEESRAQPPLGCRTSNHMVCAWSLMMLSFGTAHEGQLMWLSSKPVHSETSSSGYAFARLQALPMSTSSCLRPHVHGRTNGAKNSALQHRKDVLFWYIQLRSPLLEPRSLSQIEISKRVLSLNAFPLVAPTVFNMSFPTAGA